VAVAMPPPMPAIPAIPRCCRRITPVDTASNSVTLVRHAGWRTVGGQPAIRAVSD
jgi:hypothetical protein